MGSLEYSGQGNGGLCENANLEDIAIGPRTANSSVVQTKPHVALRGGLDMTILPRRRGKPIDSNNLKTPPDIPVFNRGIMYVVVMICVTGHSM